jgi:arylsulfatase A-like enzyme
MDFFPTILAAAGVSLPSDRAIDGLDLRPVLDQTGSLNRDTLYWHAPHYRLLRSTDGEVYTVSPNSAIRCGDWKLIRYYETTSQNAEACNAAEYELFDLENDISETTNLAQREPRKLAELKARLEAWLEEVNARLPENP